MNPDTPIISWEQADQIMQDQRAEIARLRLAAAECVAEKAADWKAACESAEAASKEIARLRLTDEERAAIWTVAEAYAENDGDQECERISRIMQGLWQRTK
jgi:hypothetical protein